MIHQLNFEHTAYHKGLNVTVCDSSRQHDVIQIGDVVHLHQNGAAGNFASGIVVALKAVVFKSIRGDELAVVNDPKYRTYPELVTHLKDTYKDFHEDHVVSLVFYIIE